MSKIACITGASAGIGKATAIKLAQNGYHLIITGRRADRLKQLSTQIQKDFKVDVWVIELDVRDKQAVINAFENLPLNWQNIDVLINNAGLSLGLDPINEGNTNDWDTMLDTNVKGLLYVTKSVSNLMIANGKGHIVNLGSIAGKETYANGNVYCASKHAVDSLTKAMRIDLLTHGIRVTAVHPGAVETEFSVVRFKGDEDRAKAVYKGFEALKAEDIADAIYYAISLPAHVNINELTIMPTAQANSGTLLRK